MRSSDCCSCTRSCALYYEEMSLPLIHNVGEWATDFVSLTVTVATAHWVQSTSKKGMNNLHSLFYNLLRVACSCCLLTNVFSFASNATLSRFCDPWQESFDSRPCTSNRNASGCWRIVGCCPSFVVVKEERLHVNNQQLKLGFRDSVIHGERAYDSRPCPSNRNAPGCWRIVGCYPSFVIVKE